MEIKIKLKVKNVDIELSLEEIKELKEILEKITGKEIIREKEYIPYYPYVIEPYPYRPWKHWESWITWKTTTGGDTMESISISHLSSS